MQGRPELSRDEVVTRGEEAKQYAITHGGRPWLYQYKVKTGTRATINIERDHYNFKDLIAWAIIHHAIAGESFNIFGAKRQIRSYYKDGQEDA